MRYVLAVVMLLLLCAPVKADVTFPMETAATGYFFVKDATWAAGVSHTFMRFSWDKFKNITLDADANLAREVSNNEDTLYGVGLKANIVTGDPARTGLNFIPSIGVTGLSNFNDIEKADDLIDSVRWAIYGSLVLYKW